MKKTLILILISIIVFFWINFFYTYKLINQKYTYKQEKYINLEKVPNKIRQFALKIEDKRFYQHFWVDFLAIIRAIKEDIKAWKFKQWASTIDQQVIKLSEWNFWKRWISTKLKEVFLATNLDFHYSKNNIFLYWINNVQFPYWVKGFKSACKVYFWRSCNKLFDSEILYLFAMYQTWKNPSTNFKLIKDRSYILCKYLKSNWENIDCNNFYQLPPVKKLKANFKKLTIFDLLPENIKSKLKINTKYQKLSQNIIENTVWYRKAINMQDCCVLIMNKTWNILTMNTCRKPWDNQNNSWINGCLIKRQTGSAIKPFLYLKAMLDLWWTWWTILEDKKIDFILNWLKKYIPRNFDMKYHGKVPLAVALGSSLNVPAVTTLNKIWVQKFLNFINKLRLELWDSKKQIKADQQTYTADKLGLSAALGTYAMTPVEFTNLWRTFLLNWKLIIDNWKWEIKNNKNNELSVIDNKIIWDYVKKINILYKILSQNKNRLISFGLENNLDVPWWAVKTWTSRHFVDGWTCGVNKNKQIVLCVWAGNYNELGMTKPGSESAGFLWNLIASKIK